MEETRHGPRAEVARAVGAWLAAALRLSIRKRGRAILAIPGGRSVAQPLARLAQEDVAWDRVSVLFVDERHLPAGHEERNDRATAGFAAAISDRGLNPYAFLSAPFVRYNPEAAADRYWDTIRELGGELDVVLLGVGEDGHIASLFPGRAELALNRVGVTAVRNAPKPPPERITMTPGLIATATWTCLLFFGEGKRTAYNAFQDAGLPVERCPAKLSRSAPYLLIAADTAAAGTDTDGRIY